MARNRTRSHTDEIERWHHGLRAVLDPKPRRRLRLRTVVAGFLLLVIAGGVAAAGVTYTYVRNRVGQIPRFACPGCVSGAGAPMTVLFIGSDTRSDIPKSEAIHFCERLDCSDQTGPEHSDAIMLMRFDPARGQAAVLSIPRDLNVRIAGTGRRDRINVAYAGGAGRVVDTIRADFGIPIDHVVTADFVGFRTIVGALGGLDVYFPTPARDVMSGLNVPDSGCVHLDGNSVLAYVRSRHYQSFTNGRWHFDPLSDLSRVQRQQDFIRRLLRKIKTVRNPFVAKRLLDSSVHWVRVDDRLSLGDLFHLGRWSRGLRPDAIGGSTLPTYPIRIGGADELTLSEPAASEKIQSFLGSSSEASAPPAAPAQAGRAQSAVSPSTVC